MAATTTSSAYGRGVLHRADVYRSWWMTQQLRRMNENLLLTYGFPGKEADMHEKQGVVAGENEVPPADKQAAASGCQRQTCCGAKQPCGTDVVSRMADEIPMPPKPDKSSTQ